MTEQMTVGLDALLEFIRDTRGFDFTGYKRSSVERRVVKRMSEVGIDEGRFEEYIDYLELNADEYAELFNTLLINVTAFFRDPPIWEHLATQVLPTLLAARTDTAPIRVWCAGCASGEEPLTVAMVLATVLGEEAFRERVKIYATDVDEQALDEARHGVYLPRQVEDVPREALERFFERTDQRYTFRKDLRRSVIFGRNDLIQDAPISRIDLLVCRNTLMYFTADTQSQVLRRFHFGLAEDGVLLLGKSEMLISHGELFTPVDLKWRVFHKVVRHGLRDRVRVMALDAAGLGPDGASESLREVAFDVTGPANLVIEPDGTVVMTNEAARRMFGLSATDLGRPVQDLELSYRPLELRSHLETVTSTGRAVEIDAVPWRHGDQERLLNVRIFPLLGPHGGLGTSVSYSDVTEASHLQRELSDSREKLEHAYEELQSTVEELETTNEELQSTNEELETTNEELQSTNEELETMNEELQSTNEELETMNEELRHRTLELNDINAFLETILTTIGLAVVVLDRRQHIQIWNHQARELWGLSSEEVVDQHLLSLDIGLPVEQLKAPVRACLAGAAAHQEVVVGAVTRRGRSIQCKVTCLPLGTRPDGEVTGVIMMMEPVDELPAPH
jgi:two-component system CheB/CheR fusion protein